MYEEQTATISSLPAPTPIPQYPLNGDDTENTGTCEARIQLSDQPKCVYPLHCLSMYNFRTEKCTHASLQTRSLVVWSTQNAPRRQQFHVAPTMPAL